MSDCIQPCDTDCEAGPVHCIWLHLPRHKQGWHDQDDCPARDDETADDDRPLVEHVTDFLADALPEVNVMRVDDDGPKPETVVVRLDYETAGER